MKYRLIWILIAGQVLFVAGCARYVVTPSQDVQTMSPANNEYAYHREVATGDLYTTIQVQVSPPPGVVLQACGENEYQQILRTRSRIITITSNSSPITPLQFPLYTVSQDGSQKCSIAYRNSYLMPRAFLDAEQWISVPASYVISDIGTEKVTDYLRAASDVAAILGPQGGAVSATLAMVVNSPAAQKLSAAANAAMANKVELSGAPFIAVEPRIRPNWDEFVSKREFLLQKVSSDGAADGPGQPLATVTTRISRRTTIIGEDPITEGRDYGMLPTYRDLSIENTSIVTLTAGQDGNVIVQRRNLFDMLNEPGNIARRVRFLPESAKRDEVEEACSSLRSTIARLQLLNKFDATAFLWRVYSLSPYARAQERTSNLESSACVEQDARLIRVLKLDGWLSRT